MAAFAEAIELFATVSSRSEFVRCLGFVGSTALDHDRFEVAARILGAVHRWCAADRSKSWDLSEHERWRARLAEHVSAEELAQTWERPAPGSLEDVAQIALDAARVLSDPRVMDEP